jgi:predicted phage gp36 major capsid-like protein
MTVRYSTSLKQILRGTSAGVYETGGHSLIRDPKATEALMEAMAAGSARRKVSDIIAYCTLDAVKGLPLTQ